MYCGGNVIVRQAIQLASGVNVANLIELAKAAASANNAKEAYDYYTKALEYDPTNAAAWAGKGEAAGWMSTVKDIKTTEMIVGFNQAIKYTPDSDKQSMRVQCADAINRVVKACYTIERKYVEQFVQVGDTWQSYLTNCQLLISALEVGNMYDSINRLTMALVVNICEDNIRGINFKAFDGRSSAVFLNDQYEVSVRARMNEYTLKIQKLNPAFKPPQVKRASAGCFVATATFGDPNHPTVVELRHFRDSWLLDHRGGLVFVRFYYMAGPSLARAVESSAFRKRLSFLLIVRPAVLVSRFLMKNCGSQG
jgi:tetratricopeptide (TPR) repeat protein